MKKRIITLIAAAAILSISAFALAAQPRGAGRGAQQAQAQNISTEQRAAVQKIIEAHQDKLYELREKIWAKHAELQALSTSGKAEKADIQNLVGEISKLRDAMHKERLAIKTEIEQQTGIKSFGRGFHHGMGYGYGSDSSCPGGGMGKGFSGGCPGGACN
jgi:zinc resistance-associated protein